MSSALSQHLQVRVSSANCEVCDSARAAVAVLAVGALPLGACSDGDDQADEGVIGSDRDTEGHGLRVTAHDPCGPFDRLYGPFMASADRSWAGPMFPVARSADVPGYTMEMMSRLMWLQAASCQS